MMVGAPESKNAKQAYYAANNHGGYYYDKNDGFFFSPSVGFHIFKSITVVFALCPCFLPYCGRSVKRRRLWPVVCWPARPALFVGWPPLLANWPQKQGPFPAKPGAVQKNPKGICRGYCPVPYISL